MKICPFCGAENDAAVFYCIKCEKSFSEAQNMDSSSASDGGFDLSLVEDDDPPPEEASPEPAARGVPQASGKGAPQQRMSISQQPATRRAKSGLFPMFSAVFVLLLGSALAYLIFDQEALTKKSAFNDRLARVAKNFSSEIEALER